MFVALKFNLIIQNGMDILNLKNMDNKQTNKQIPCLRHAF